MHRVVLFFPDIVRVPVTAQSFCRLLLQPGGGSRFHRLCPAHLKRFGTAARFRVGRLFLLGTAQPLCTHVEGEVLRVLRVPEGYVIPAYLPRR